MGESGEALSAWSDKGETLSSHIACLSPWNCFHGDNWPWYWSGKYSIDTSLSMRFNPLNMDGFNLFL